MKWLYGLFSGTYQNFTSDCYENTTCNSGIARYKISSENTAILLTERNSVDSNILLFQVLKSTPYHVAHSQLKDLIPNSVKMERHWQSTRQRLSESLTLVLISTRDEIRLNTLDETFTTVFIPASRPHKHNYRIIALITLKNKFLKIHPQFAKVKKMTDLVDSFTHKRQYQDKTFTQKTIHLFLDYHI